MKIAIIDKAPSKNNYSKYFDFEFELLHMSSVPTPKLLKKNVDLVVNTEDYDYIICVGAEATKEYAKVSVTAYSGQLVNNKFLPMSNPAIMIFKPEGKPEFERNLDIIKNYIKGTLSNIVKTGDFKGIQTEEGAKYYLKFLLSLPANSPIALDSETSALSPRDGYMLGISLSHKISQGVYISCDVLNEDNIELLQQVCDKHNIIFHNRKFDQKWFNYHLNIVFKSNCDDTMVMHYLLDETPGSHGLKLLALKHTTYGAYDKPLDDFKKEYCKANGIKASEFSYEAIPFDIMYPYAAMDTAVTLEIYEKFKPIIDKNEKLKKLYETIMLPATEFLNEIEENGIPIDRARMDGASQYLEREIEAAKAKVYAFDAVKKFEADHNKIFNPNSVQQLRAVLFTYLGLDPVRGKLTATGAISTDAEVLGILAEQHELPAAILIVRKLTKIKNTYVNKILPALDKDGKIRTNFNLIFTTSGRLSSSGKFNAQQIPRDNPIIKGCIKASTGYKIISQDLATAEVYYAAVLSGDKKMQGIFLAGGDFHSATAKLVFSLTCNVEDVKNLFPALRQAAKAVTFGILYGSGAKSVAETVTKSGSPFSIEEAQDAINDYYTTFATLKKWLDARKKEIQTNGFIYTFFGRKRRLANVFSPDKGIAAHEVRSGINALIQSLASDMNLLAAIEVNDIIKLENLDAKIFMLVHDSIVIHSKEEHVARVLEILKECTQRDRGCSIPGFPIGIDQDISDDYSFGAFEKMYGQDAHGLYKLDETDNSVNWILNTEIDEEDEEELV